jgi:hypothetical protein
MAGPLARLPRTALSGSRSTAELLGLRRDRVPSPLYLCWMPITLAQLQTLITDEYARLTTQLSLKPVPLDVYVITQHQASTALGTDTRNATAAYSPTRGLIVLPANAGDLVDGVNYAPAFPPSSWLPLAEEWPWWRTELWHEVVHQFQHQTLNLLDLQDGCEGHCTGWLDAITDVAKVFGADPTALKAVI